MLHTPRPPAKGVGFSDELIVLGPSSSASSSPTSLPKAKVFVHRGQVAEHYMRRDPCADAPGEIRSLSEHFEHTAISEETLVADPVSSLRVGVHDVVVRPVKGGKRARFEQDHHAEEEEEEAEEFEELEEELEGGSEPDDVVETSCTDSDASDGKRRHMLGCVLVEGAPLSDHDLRKCTRINTRINSMPSGGDFSFMNSSEDVETEESSSSEEDDLRLSRKMIRVDGSAKLSSASGLGDDDSEEEEDEFGIEGAERVEEEEPVHVKSFGRSFAKVSLRDGEDVIIRDPRLREKGSFGADEIEERREYSGNMLSSGEEEKGDREKSPKSNDLISSKSTPPRRKSRLKMAFAKRSSTASSPKSLDLRCTGDIIAQSKNRDVNRQVAFVEHNDSDSDMFTESDFGPPSCFPHRKTNMLRQRAKTMSGERPSNGQKRRKSLCHVNGVRGGRCKRSATAGDGASLVVVPDMDEQVRRDKEGEETAKKIVKNVSLQRDDWIEFATNAASRQKHPWLIRLVSSNGRPSPLGSPNSSPDSKTTCSRSDMGGAMGSSKHTGRRRKRFFKWFGRK